MHFWLCSAESSFQSDDRTSFHFMRSHMRIFLQKTKTHTASFQRQLNFLWTRASAMSQGCVYFGQSLQIFLFNLKIAMEFVMVAHQTFFCGKRWIGLRQGNAELTASSLFAAL